MILTQFSSYIFDRIVKFSDVYPFGDQPIYPIYFHGKRFKLIKKFEGLYNILGVLKQLVILS